MPPPVIAANRAQLATLVATNIFGQNTPAIAATEAQYGEMWAQDAAAMYGYAATSAAATRVTPFTAPPQTTNPAGAAAQAAAAAQATGTSTGTGVQSTLSQLISTIPSTLQSLASPAASSTSSTSGLSGILSGLGVSSSGRPRHGLAGLGSTGPSLLEALLELRHLGHGFLACSAGIDAIGATYGYADERCPHSSNDRRPAAAAPLQRSGCGGRRGRAAAAGGAGRFCGLGRFGGPRSSGLSRRVVGAAELGLGRDSSGGDAGRRAVGDAVAGAPLGGQVGCRWIRFPIRLAGWGGPQRWALEPARALRASKYAATPQRAWRAHQPLDTRRGAGVRVASNGEISGARRIPDERTRAPRIPAGDRIRADQRTCARPNDDRKGRIMYSVCRLTAALTSYPIGAIRLKEETICLHVL